jgi:hypothetical protein
MRTTIGFAVVMALAACGGGGKDFFAEPVEQAGDELAVRGCEEIFTCGVLTIFCGDTCTASYQAGEAAYPDGQASCEAQLGVYYRTTLMGCVNAHLTEDQLASINDCFNRASPDCYTDEELVEIGQLATMDLPYGPEECVAASALLSLCEVCYEDPSDPRCQ